MTSEQPDKIIPGEDLVGFWMQPGFVEGMIADGKLFGSLEETYRHLFRRNTEYAVFLWNGIPVRLDYRTDIPVLIGGLIELWKNLLEKQDHFTDGKKT